MTARALRMAEALIKRHEGYRDTVYSDTAGIPTVGWGHAFFHKEASPGETFSKEACQLFFDDDFLVCIQDFEYLALEFLSDARQAVILDMLFNLGLPKLKKFVNFMDRLRNRDWQGAAIEMRKSRWANQVGNRAVEDAEILITDSINGVLGNIS